MLEFRPLTAELAMGVKLLESIHAGFEITPEIAVELEAIGGMAAIDGDEVLAIGGVLPRWEGVGMAWVWLGRRWRKHAKAITTEIKRTLDAGPWHRVEIGIKLGYLRGEAWARNLGFVVETPVASKWGNDGSDYSIWVRVK